MSRDSIFSSYENEEDEENKIKKDIKKEEIDENSGENEEELDFDNPQKFNLFDSDLSQDE